MPVDREAVRSNALYLREVRPIDPEEIAAYVPEYPDPRVVRQVLREEAFDLALAERPDGTFVPAGTGPFRPAFDGVRALPQAYADRLTDLLVETYGPDWYQGEEGASLRSTIKRLKADYYRQHDVEYDFHVAIAYAIYHLADYYATTQYVLASLAEDDLLPHQARILDVGAGVGGPALGIHDFYAPESPTDESIPIVDYHAVEPSEAADVLDWLLGATGDNFYRSIHRETAEAFDSGMEFDIVLFSAVLSELESPVDVLGRYLEFLATDGTLISIAPADRNTSIHLREVERAIEAHGGTVYGPTVRLWPGGRPSDECWSFDEQPDIEVPSFQERLATTAERPSEFTNTSIKYSHSFVRLDGRRRHEMDLSETAVAKMAEMDRHVSNRIDLVAAKLSNDLGTAGHPLFKVSDGSERTSHFAVLVNETSLNVDLRTAEYGDLLSFERVLALWNEDEGAYNLVVDDETIVDRFPS